MDSSSRCQDNRVSFQEKLIDVLEEPKILGDLLSVPVTFPCWHTISKSTIDNVKKQYSICLPFEKKPGKTTLLREIAKELSENAEMRVRFNRILDMQEMLQASEPSFKNTLLERKNKEEVTRFIEILEAYLKTADYTEYTMRVAFERIDRLREMNELNDEQRMILEKHKHEPRWLARYVLLELTAFDVD